VTNLTVLEEINNDAPSPEVETGATLNMIPPEQELEPQQELDGQESKFCF
jgi:hypothetical protein